MTGDELLTKKDLELFKQELIALLKPAAVPSQWLKNKDVCKLLGISNSSLANLRVNGTLVYHKIGGTYLYKQSDIDKMLSAAEKKSPKTR